MKLSWHTRRALYLQAAAQLDNGLAMTAILNDFALRLLRRGRDKQAAAVRQVERALRDGRPLTSALGDSLKPVERSILSSGEQAGTLAAAMRLVVDVQERTARIASGFRSALVAPAVYIASLWLVLWIIGSMVTPQFTVIVPIERWTGWAYLMYLMGEMAVGWFGWTTLAAAGVLVPLVLWSRTRWSGPGRAWWDRHIWPYTLYRDVDGFVWLMGYVALLRAGVTDTNALRMQASSAGPWLSSRLRPLLARLRNGMSLPQAMRATGYSFPSPDLIDEIAAYVGFADFAAKIEKVAQDYANTMEERMKQVAWVTGFICSTLMFAAMAVVQLGANDIQSIMQASLGSF
jgi:type II secretory pathway component PulF